MSSTIVICSIFYDGQFWVAEFERYSQNTLQTARHIFGPEPNNAELREWSAIVSKNLKWSQAVQSSAPHEEQRLNPKRAKRLAIKQRKIIGLSNKAHDAMKIARHFNNKASSNTC
ncbi:YjdF family protein [Polycladidibacter stylochi]|uniref:YjdF family protein n=1 Tax=Polycladidibacter stylochi TaxID=1807766 RepID=UPI000835BDA8|nr:YjdF family protein [Pseudovibrio stylochi]